jgi:hypothetical protein
MRITNNVFEVIIVIAVVIDIQGHHRTCCSRINAAAGATHYKQQYHTLPHFHFMLFRARTESGEE